MMIGIVYEVYDDWDFFFKYMMIGIVFEVYDDWYCL
jgi:hypothetical protein